MKSEYRSDIKQKPLTAEVFRIAYQEIADQELSFSIQDLELARAASPDLKDNPTPTYQQWCKLCKPVAYEKLQRSRPNRLPDKKTFIQ